MELNKQFIEEISRFKTIYYQISKNIHTSTIENGNSKKSIFKNN